MKRKIFYTPNFLCILLLPFAFAACTAMDSPTLAEPPQYFIEVLHEEDIHYESFLNTFRAYGYLLEGDGGIVSKIAGLGDKLVGSRIVKAYSIAYRTVDPFGKEIVASGSIYVPENFAVKGVVEAAPVAYLQKTAAASARRPCMEAVQSLFGYISIIPDMLGYGTTQDTHYYTFLDVENNGRVGYDMRQAAREFLATKGIALPAKTMIYGYSLGGSTALAMLKYYELYGKEVQVEKAIIGSGCLEPTIAFREFAQTGISDYPIIPTLIYGKNLYHNLGLDFSKIFRGELLEHYEEWLDRADAHSAAFLRDVLGRDMHTYMHPDFFTEAKNSEFKKVYDVMAGCSHVDGWTPKAELHIYHDTDDTVVPFECSRYAYEQFKSRGADVVMYSGTGGHHGYAAVMYLATYLFLLLR